MSQDKSSKSEESEILQEIKKLLMNIVDMPTTDNSDIDVLKVIGFKPRFIEPINEVLFLFLFCQRYSLKKIFVNVTLRKLVYFKTTINDFFN